MEVKQILKELKKHSSKKNREGMKRFGINVDNAYGTSIYVVRKIGKPLKKNHGLALKLWKTGVLEARMMACFIDDPEKVSERQFDSWVKDFNSWDICDQCCGNLLDKTPFIEKKIRQYSKDKREFVKRTAFVLMATKSVHDKEAKNSVFEKYFPIIKKEATDERNFVRKAVNWALRQIGKRNLVLNKKAIKVAKEIKKIDSKAARWIANDAIRELESDAVQKRLRK